MHISCNRFICDYITLRVKVKATRNNVNATTIFNNLTTLVMFVYMFDEYKVFCSVKHLIYITTLKPNNKKVNSTKSSFY